VLDERDSVAAAATSIQDGEVVLVLADRVDAVVERLESLGATASTDPRALIARRVRVAQPAA
jgi:hypothetical protein